MIGYATVGTNDLERACKYYDELLGEMGAGRAMATDRVVLWAIAPGTPMFGVIIPENGKAASVGNGDMIGLVCETTAQVDAMYAKAIALGGTDEGKPGPRGDDGAFYGGYFRDLDGNKFVFFNM